MKLVCVHGLGHSIAPLVDNAVPRTFRERAKDSMELLKSIEEAKPIVDDLKEVVAWCVHDLVTHRWFGKIPPEHEPQFVALVAKCYEIADENAAPEPRGDETVFANRVKDVAIKLKNYKFFYEPQVIVKNTKYSRDPNLWSIFMIHDRTADVPQMRDFAQKTMITLVQFVRAVNSIEPFIADTANRA
jgi:hypothetical protein